MALLEFSLDFENARAIHSKTGGLPLEVVKFMRDAIDNYRMNDSGSNRKKSRNSVLF